MTIIRPREKPALSLQAAAVVPGMHESSVGMSFASLKLRVTVFSSQIKVSGLWNRILRFKNHHRAAAKKNKSLGALEPVASTFLVTFDVTREKDEPELPFAAALTTRYQRRGRNTLSFSFS